MSGPEPHSTVAQALAAIAAGKIVVVSDGEDRENEADLVMAAQFADPASVGFLIRHTGGLLCVPLPDAYAAELDLHPMTEDNTDLHGTAFTVSVDHVATGTGISASDRSTTIQALAAAATPASAFRRPGHVFPLVARAGGVLKRAGHTEAAVDLAQLAGLAPVGLISELVSEDGQPLAPGDAARFARRHGLAHITIEQLQRHRRTTESLVTRGGSASLPTAHGDFRAQAYVSRLDGVEHLALTIGDVAWREDDEPVLVRVHSECLTGDVLGSQRCDCGAQLDRALEMIAAEGRGVLVYLRGHEGRGIGLSHKLNAYTLQEQGLDTVDANLQLGFPVDSREYGIGAHILADLGVRRMRLLTNNPAKHSGLACYDLDIVDRVPLRIAPKPANLRYLSAKQQRLGHDLGLTEGDAAAMR